MKLSEFLDTLEFHAPKKSSEYVGKKEQNPVMLLEENVAAWLRQTDLDDLQMSLKIFQDRVCIQGYPAIYSPQFWIANATLTAIYDVMIGYLKTPAGVEHEGVLSDVLFELWIKLLNAGPGSTHLHMLNIILKSHNDLLWKYMEALLFELWIKLLNTGPGSTHLHMLNIILKSHGDLLWKYMESLRGENLKTLIHTLRTDFVYKEDVSPEHYATLMETHIDKIFRSIFSSDQFEETRRDLLDLQIYYLSRMNHVPPHIGPRLSHLCFLICNRYELENPYLGIDDWVLMRNHIKYIKDVITNSSFTKASEAQYRAPIILEKILHAAVVDKMLDVMFKDFMVLLQTITNNQYSKKCVRLYNVYHTGLFELIDLKKGFEECPYFLFKQCIQALAQLANSNMLEPHIEDFICTTQNNFLLKFTKLSSNESAEWHQLLVNYIVSGRRRLVKEASYLLSNTVLVQNGVTDWKNHTKECRMLIDIIADLPKDFLQSDEHTTRAQSVAAYSTFLQELFGIIAKIEEGGGIQTEVRPNVHRCIVKCIEKDADVKASICMSCVKSNIPDFKDLIYVREVLFTIEKLLKSEDCPRYSDELAHVINLILQSCLKTFRDKGYIGVDFNSLLMSITLTCVNAPEETTVIQDMFDLIYQHIVPIFIQMHCDKGSLQTVASLVNQTLSAMKDAILKGTSCCRCVEFIQMMGTKSFKLLTDQDKLIIELFIDWCCVDLKDIVKELYSDSHACLIGRFQDLFDLVTKIDLDQCHHVLDVLHAVSVDNAQLFQDTHIHTLLEIYPEVNPQSRDFIMKLLLQVLDHSPKLLYQYVDYFVDESKFSTDFFDERCRIITTLLDQNMDLAVKTEDFLMKYITHSDDTVALTAMQNLAPLIKPNMNAPRKARLKVLLKSIKCAEVKSICENLAQEPRNNSRKPPSKPLKSAQEAKVAPAKTQPVKPNKPVVKAPPPAPKATPPAKTPPIVQNTSSSTETGWNTPRKSPRGLNSIQQSGVTSPRIHTDAQVESIEGNKAVQKLAQIPSDIKQSVSDGHMLQEKSFSPLPDIRTESAQRQMPIDGSQDIKSESTRNGDSSAKFSPSLNKEGKNLADETPAQTSLQTDSNIGAKDSDGANKATEIVGIYNSKEDSGLSKAVGIYESEKDANATKPVGIYGSEKDTDFTKPVGIYGSERDKFRLLAFSSLLKDAGFENDLVCDGAEVSLLEDVRVVIICYSSAIEKDQLTKIKEHLDDRQPVLPLKLDKTESISKLPVNIVTKCAPIRMFTKAGETTIRGHWPALKFYELLMHLNYQGILPENQLLSTDFREWWHPHSESKPVSRKKQSGKRSVNRSSTASVFFSYHWGKQRQVEPLYKYLTDQGISCWVGLQQIGGSESLYNKISQGIQECRVVLACITSQYACTENCQQEINIALGLNRPVIPLLVKTEWPIMDDIGAKLQKFDCIRLKLTSDGKIDVKADSIKAILNRLNSFIPVDEKGVKNSGQTELKTENVDTNKHTSGDNVDGQEQVLDNKKALKTVEKLPSEQNIAQQIGHGNSMNSESVNLKSPVNSVKIQKSMSMYELEKNRNLSSRIGAAESLRSGGSKSSMEIDRRKSQYDFPEGVVVDEFGYTVKTNRSKSCVIL